MKLQHVPWNFGSFQGPISKCKKKQLLSKLDLDLELAKTVYVTLFAYKHGTRWAQTPVISIGL